MKIRRSAVIVLIFAMCIVPNAFSQNNHDFQQSVSHIDTLYNDLYSFYAKIYDSKSGGFFETLEKNTPPRIESTARSITALDKGGVLNSLPDDIKQDFVKFLQSFQDSATGFFDDPNEKRVLEMRRGRALGYATGALEKLNSAPLYDLPKADGQKTQMDYLSDTVRFNKWLNNLNWNQPWRTGGTISAQRKLIELQSEPLRSQLIEALFNYLAEKQNTETGYWGSDIPYHQLSGAFKLSMTYEWFNKPMPKADKIYESTLAILYSEKCTHACFARNTLHLLKSISDQVEIPESVKIRVIQKSIENIALFKTPDGGFSLHLKSQYGSTDGCSQAMKVRDAVREFAGLEQKPFPNGASFLTALKIKNNKQFSKKSGYQPLDTFTLSIQVGKTIEVSDGKGNVYFSDKVKPEISFVIGGFPGYHQILIRDKKNNVIDHRKFFVQCETQIITDNDELNQLFERLKWNMFKPGEAKIVRYNDQPYFLMSDWLRDHANILKGKKYFSAELKDAIDLFAENQLDNGMIYDFYRPASKNYWVERFENRNFIDLRVDEGHVFQRVPVENDVEYWFVMGIFHTWQATGDNNWMKERLLNAEKALQYNMNSPYVWSDKYRLLKRAFTIDTWDFTPKDDAAFVGGDKMESIPGKSRYGIMHGDNTGFALACKMLSDMYAFTNNTGKAAYWEQISSQILKRLDNLSWNGHFYTHFIDENEGVTRDMGVDLSAQVSLSNSFALNRGIDHDKATQIIKIYQNIRAEMPEKSPGEFYAIYPPFKKGFKINEWHYVNGGVFPFIGGELALGAYENGCEPYASDILMRINDLMDIDDGDLPYYYIGNIPERPETNFTPLSIDKQANVDFSGQGAENVQGWTGEGTDNDLSDMPTGKQVFEGVPYQIVNPQQNQQRGCIGLAKTDPYIQSAELRINKKAQSIYFLHTLAGSGMAGWVDVHYADGITHREYVESGKQLKNWWNPMDGKYSRVTGWSYKKAWSYNNGRSEVGVYQWGFDNPHPDKKIEKVVFQHALNTTKWFVLGITLSDQPAYFTWPKSTGTHLVNWHAGAVMRAYIEGLAGIKDQGASFKKVTISPRWSSAGVKASNVTVKYPASNEYIKYSYHSNEEEIDLTFTGTFHKSELRFLLPEGKSVNKVVLDGEEIEYSLETIKKSIYLVLDIEELRVHWVQVGLNPNG